MFDEIICEFKLPILDDIDPAIDTVYQTKDLEQTLSKFYITVDGKFETEVWVPDDEKWNPLLKRMIPGRKFSHREEYKDDKGRPLHGRIKFYTNEFYDDSGNYSKLWIDYEVTFTEGELTSIIILG